MFLIFPLQLLKSSPPKTQTKQSTPAPSFPTAQNIISPTWASSEVNKIYHVFPRAFEKSSYLNEYFSKRVEATNESTDVSDIVYNQETSASQKTKIRWMCHFPSGRNHLWYWGELRSYRKYFPRSIGEQKEPTIFQITGYLPKNRGMSNVIFYSLSFGAALGSNLASLPSLRRDGLPQVPVFFGTRYVWNDPKKKKKAEN